MINKIINFQKSIIQKFTVIQKFLKSNSFKSKLIFNKKNC